VIYPLPEFLEAIVRVFKWQDSLAVCLPHAVVEALKVKEGDEIEIVAGISEVQIGHAGERTKALQRMRLLQKPLPPGFRFRSRRGE
jgi:antitoxin MazE